MALRLIIKTDEARVPGSRATHFRTVDVDLPEVERILSDGGYNLDGTFLIRHLIGAEVIHGVVGTLGTTKNKGD
ncbi:MAG: hypothetical protein WC696_12710 [Candidatus Methylopumilus sp.]|jgi:hypothetical protein